MTVKYTVVNIYYLLLLVILFYCQVTRPTNASKRRVKKNAACKEKHRTDNITWPPYNLKTMAHETISARADLSLDGVSRSPGFHSS